METDGTECSTIQSKGESSIGNLTVKFSGLNANTLATTQ